MLKDYVRFQLGEGIEKEADDFAAEVAACRWRACSLSAEAGRLGHFLRLRDDLDKWRRGALKRVAPLFRMRDRTLRSPHDAARA